MAPTPTPVTVERLAGLFDDMGADYALITKDDGAGQVLQTGLPHIIIHCEVEDGTLSAFASWEARLPAAYEDRVATALAEFNWAVPVPSLSYVVDEEGDLLIGANRAMGVAEGLTRNQLGAFILDCFDSFAAAFYHLAEVFPAAAPGTEGMHDNA